MYNREKQANFSVIIKSRDSSPNPWRWEIHRAGVKSAVGSSSENFPTMRAAKEAGKRALAQLFAKHQILG
jgi:hypothetical protein